MWREGRSLRSPPLFLEHLLTGSDSMRDRLIRAQSWLEWLGEKLD